MMFFRILTFRTCYLFETIHCINYCFVSLFSLFLLLIKINTLYYIKNISLWLRFQDYFFIFICLFVFLLNILIIIALHNFPFYFLSYWLFIEPFKIIVQENLQLI